jgi:hypothetical protein
MAEQWIATMYPRIFHLLPTRLILEIASGFGRWTPYLTNHCTTYNGADIAERCIARCRRTYGPLAMRPISCWVTGLLWPANSMSLVFSLDSLVHTNLECLTSCAGQVRRVLEPGGHAFLHHPNLAEYAKDGVLSVAVLHRIDITLSAALAASILHRAALISLVHEQVQRIATDAAIDPFCDCLSLIAKPLGMTSQFHSPAMPIFCIEASSGKLPIAG